MAMRPRGTAAAATPNRTQPGGATPVFEDFKPTSEWQQDHDSHILIIYLPGFLKEQIRVSTEGWNIVRVRGERMVASNKWSRFLEDFQVPQNCEMNSIRARFQGGILHITVPKKSANKPQDALPPETTTMTNTTTPKQATPPKGQNKVGASTPIDDRNQKASGDSKIKQDLVDVPRDRRSITPLRVVPQDVEKRESSEFKEKHVADKTINKVAEKDGKNLERSKELPENEDEPAQKMKLKKDEGAKENNKESERKQIIHTTGADYGAFTVDKYKKAVKGLADLNEERQLLVNMGVAVLVIVALSAYVTYKFASGKDKN